MLFEDLFSVDDIQSTQLQPIVRNCSQYLNEAGSLPLLKNLPASYAPIQRVKVRLQKRKDQVSEAFNAAFGEQFSNIRERAVFASPRYLPSLIGQEPFYVFPIDGYQYFYSKEVLNSGLEYKNVIDTLVENIGDGIEATSIVSDLLKFTYESTGLQEGIQHGSEIIIYNIPMFFAVKSSACKGYEKLIHAINRLR